MPKKKSKEDAIPEEALDEEPDHTPYSQKKKTSEDDELEEELD